MNRLFLLLFLPLLLAAQAHAQQGATLVKYRRDKPVQIITLRNNSNTAYDQKFERKLHGEEGFTRSEAAAIMSLINSGGNKPDGLSYEIREATAVVARYKAYQQCYFSKWGLSYAIVWLPYEENQHMPEGLRPTAKEGCVLLLDADYLTSSGKNKAGAALPIAGTPVPPSDMPPPPTTTTSSSTAASGNMPASGTTASGVQYSTADMSMFGPALLGCMAIYPSNGSSYMYVVSIYGASLGDKAAVADEAYKVTGLADSRHTYQWFPGDNATTLQQRYKRSMNVQISGKYTIR